jgi:hypothetical protein
MPGNSTTLKFPLVNKETGEAAGVSVYDYFAKYSTYKTELKHPL